MSGEWWREKIPEGEEVLWYQRPEQGFFPLRFGWFYKMTIGLFALIWLASPWMIETAGDFWKIFVCTIGLVLFLWADRFIRAQRVYVVTSQKAWEINKDLKSKYLKIDRFLNFSCHRRRVTFDRHPFFSFNHLSDPTAALQALKQARETAQ